MNYDWISRKQVEIIHKRHGDIILIPLSSKCDTYYGGEKLKKNESIQIYTGTQIRFANDYFINVLGYNDDRIKLLREARLSETIVINSSSHPQKH